MRCFNFSDTSDLQSSARKRLRTALFSPIRDSCTGREEEIKANRDSCPISRTGTFGDT